MFVGAAPETSAPFCFGAAASKFFHSEAHFCNAYIFQARLHPHRHYRRTKYSEAVMKTLHDIVLKFSIVIS